MGMSEKCFGLPGRKVLPGVGVGGTTKAQKKPGQTCWPGMGPKLTSRLGSEDITYHGIYIKRETHIPLHTYL